jgi:hypothetical protein
MIRNRWVAVVSLVGLLACGSLLAAAETIITSGGSVLQGMIEFGIPAVVSITSSTGDVFTVQKSNLKSIRFPERKNGDVTVETFDGNILVGTLGGVPEVIGLESSSGDVQSVRLESIVEIRFDPSPEAGLEPEAPQPTTPSEAPAVTTPSVPRSAAAVVETHKGAKGGISIGLDTGLQLGFTSKSGLDTPRWTLGFNFLTLGAVWRSYFGPSAARVEETAVEIAAEDPTLDTEELLEATQEEVTPFILPYLHVGTNTLIIPEIGGGIMLRLGRAFYIDLGATIDVLGFPWISVGLQIVL